jgi:hypothetical protein
VSVVRRSAQGDSPHGDEQRDSAMTALQLLLALGLCVLVLAAVWRMRW